MKLPKITKECFIAHMHKAMQQDPQIYAIETMLKLKDEQPAITTGVASMLGPFIDATSGEEDEQTVSLSAAKEVLLMACFCVVGVTLQAIDAQIESEEMNEIWG